MRGNVTTRLDKLTRENLGGIVLAAAGLRRLGLSPSNAIDLPVEAFVPAPGQGAMAVQCRADDRAIVALARQLNDSPTARAVGAERAFLAQVGVGCATPVAALAHVTEAGMVHLHSQLFSDDGKRMAEAREEDRDGESLGRAMAMRLRSDLEQRP
jgi:hydroxymethylbilane synthase